MARTYDESWRCKEKSVPKITLVAPPLTAARSIPVLLFPICARLLEVLGAVESVATACMLESSPAGDLADLPEGPIKKISVEHPLGEVGVVAEVSVEDGALQIHQAAIVRTAASFSRVRCLSQA